MLAGFLRHRARPCRDARAGRRSSSDRSARPLNTGLPPDAARPPDAGFTMAELLVSIGVIGVVMASLMSFFVATVSVTNQQSGKQAAIQIANDGSELVRALRGASIVGGRDRVSSDAQWASPPSGVAGRLSTMVEAWDPTATYPAGASAPLPTTPVSVLSNRVTYQRHFFVGTCWQPSAGGECDATRSAGDVEFYRVLIAVTWPDRHCRTGACSYVASTLVSGALGEPVFDDASGTPAPVVNQPGARTGEVTVPDSLLLTSSSGIAPMTWSATGLPPGVTAASNGVISGTPTTPGDFSVTVRVIDARRQAGSANLVWKINALPQLVAPGPQTTTIGTPVSLPLQVNGGTAPYTWSVATPGPWGQTGLPPGLSINPQSGVISGSPTTAGPARGVTVTVRDVFGKTSTRSFDWTIGGPLTIASPRSDLSGTVGATVSSIQAVATGGTAPYSWSATNLPQGLSISPSGLISGVYRGGTRYLVTLRVTDAVGATDAVTLAWTVASSGVRITSPTTDQTDGVGQFILSLATATGGGSGYTWTATGLPPGVMITDFLGQGLFIGISYTPGTYVVRLTATADNGQSAVYMFRWTITASAWFTSWEPDSSMGPPTVARAGSPPARLTLVSTSASDRRRAR